MFQSILVAVVYNSIIIEIMRVAAQGIMYFTRKGPMELSFTNL